MSYKTTKSPRIRFSDFTDSWEQRDLKDMVDISSGRDYKHLSKGNIPVYGTGGYMVSVNEALSYDKDAVGIGRKGTIDKPYLLRAPFWTVDTLFYMFPKEKNDLNFVHLVFQLVNWKQKDESTSVPSLSKTIINAVSVATPTFDEQAKLGHFFNQIDDLITSHQRKTELMKQVKKSLLQKMFPKKGTNIPEIRFKEFTGSWEQRQLKEYLTTSKVKNKDKQFGKEDVLSVSGEFGIVNQIEFQGRSFAGVSVTSYGVVETGDVVYTKSPLKANPFGIIKTHKKQTGIVSTLYAVYKPNNNVDSEFIERYFEDNQRLNRYLKPLVNKGAKNDMKVSDDNALIGAVIFPIKIEEQQKVSLFFNQLDTIMTFYEHQLNSLKILKVSLLQQMFK